MEIKPLHGNVDNANYIDTDSFPIDEVPLVEFLGMARTDFERTYSPFLRQTQD
jgi:hypothetical protein